MGEGGGNYINDLIFFFLFFLVSENFFEIG